LAHIVTGIIAKPSVLEAFSREHSLHGPVALAGALAILPLREADLGSLRCAPSDGEAEFFQYLSKELLDLLRRSSHEEPLMYFETEYFGGAGGQGAVVFQDGDLIFGPHWAEVGPINQALKLLGVSCGPPARDEFEAVGLHLHRDAEGWLRQR
jgi:hypothetical protein